MAPATGDGVDGTGQFVTHIERDEGWGDTARIAYAVDATLHVCQSRHNGWPTVAMANVQRNAGTIQCTACRHSCALPPRQDMGTCALHPAAGAPQGKHYQGLTGHHGGTSYSNVSVCAVLLVFASFAHRKGARVVSSPGLLLSSAAPLHQTRARARAHTHTLTHSTMCLHIQIPHLHVWPAGRCLALPGHG